MKDRNYQSKTSNIMDYDFSIIGISVFNKSSHINYL